MSDTEDEAREVEENWDLVDAPLGEDWSGRTRYAAAMYLYKRGEMPAEVLEVYRICSRLDRQDPLPIVRDRGVGKAWIAAVEARRSARKA